MSNELDNIIILKDEECNEVEFELMDVIEYNGEEYVILFPVGQGDEGEVVIFKLEDTENEDEDSYISVDDENILMTIFNIFKDKFQDEFNFLD